MGNMIRNIAVIVAGTDEEYQSSVLEGIIAAAKERDVNIACFAAFGGVLANHQYDIGEYNIYTLVNYSRFDGVILLTNTISDPGIRQQVIEDVKQSGIPAVVLDSDENPEFYNIRIDNTTAMREIVQHLITEHGAKTFHYISGPLANPEAHARYMAFLEVLAENQLCVDARRVFFGEFRPIDGRRAAEAILHSELSMPDAIVCANDAMALEAASILIQNGVRVPEDVMVTGFDNTYYARHHSPSLTSVARPLYDAGYAACDLIFRVLNGEQCEKTVNLTAEPVYQESCGCCSSEMLDMQAYKQSTYDLLKHARTDIALLNRMTSALAETETAEENMRVMGDFLREMQCEQCSICLCMDWQSAFRDAESFHDAANDTVNGYTASMTAPLIWTEGKISSIASFPKAAMYPVQPETGGNVSFFLPLHFRERCLGYYIMTNSAFPIKSMLCHSIMINISHSLENIRKLLHLNNAIRELDRLYVIDPLCNIYNRNGFIRLADQMYKRCEASGESMLISFIDMDGLKLVNDNYGHDEGDFALQRLATVISETCTGDQICARFGGDEFIIIGTRAQQADVEHLEQNFKKRLALMNAVISKPYELAASIGTFVTEIDPETRLFSLITQADQMMYEQKKRKRTSRYLRKE